MDCSRKTGAEAMKSLRNTILSAIVFVWFFGALLVSLTALLYPGFPTKNYAVAVFAIAFGGLLLNFKPTQSALFKKIRKIFNHVLYIADIPWGVTLFMLLAFFCNRIPMCVIIFAITSVAIPVILLFCEEKSNTCEVSISVQSNHSLPRQFDYILLSVLILSAFALFLSLPIFPSIAIAGIPCFIYIADLIACRYGGHKWSNVRFMVGLIFISSAWVCQIVNHYCDFFNNDVYFAPPFFLSISSAIFILRAFCTPKKANNP